MIQKLHERKKAITLRKRGLSYREILKQVDVAKSTLSLWLGEVGLSKTQKQRITKKRLTGSLKGAEARHQECLTRTKEIKETAQKDIVSISAEELHIIGAVLYWAEGSKEKEAHPGSRVHFTNSDPEMIKLFLAWLSRSYGVSRDQITLELYIHENHRYTLERAIKFLASVTNFHASHFTQVYFKRNKVRTNRTNIGDHYYGLLRVTVRKSADLNRRIVGWIEGIIKQCNI